MVNSFEAHEDEVFAKEVAAVKDWWQVRSPRFSSLDDVGAPRRALPRPRTSS